MFSLIFIENRLIDSDDLINLRAKFFWVSYVTEEILQHNLKFLTNKQICISFLIFFQLLNSNKPDSVFIVRKQKS
jgi:hypothetical protein